MNQRLKSESPKEQFFNRARYQKEAKQKRESSYQKPAVSRLNVEIYSARRCLNPNRKR